MTRENIPYIFSTDKHLSGYFSSKVGWLCECQILVEMRSLDIHTCEYCIRICMCDYVYIHMCIKEDPHLWVFVYR